MKLLFRGQIRRYGEKVNVLGDKLPGKWVYGGVLQGNCSHSIIYGTKEIGLQKVKQYPVYTDTLGQYVQINDVNEKPIFTGDIVVFETSQYKFKPCYVNYSNEHARFVVQRGKKTYPMDSNFKYEIIGNIHDNSKLTEEIKKGDEFEDEWN